jgi:hypothetical protein
MSVVWKESDDQRIRPRKLDGGMYVGADGKTVIALDNGVYIPYVGDFREDLGFSQALDGFITRWFQDEVIKWYKDNGVKVTVTIVDTDRSRPCWDL